MAKTILLKLNKKLDIKDQYKEYIRIQSVHKAAYWLKKAAKNNNMSEEDMAQFLMNYNKTK